MKISHLICLFIIILSCERKEQDPFESRLSRYLDTGIEKCIVIPREGCGGCISDATQYVLDNKHKLTKTKIIFTGIYDFKELKHTIGSRLLANNFIVIDSTNSMMDASVVSNYPYIYYFKDKRLIKKEKFDLQKMIILNIDRHDNSEQ